MKNCGGAVHGLAGRKYGQTAAANFRAALRGSSCGVAPKTPTAPDVKIDALKALQLFHIDFVIM